ncbi:MAG TPA: hypothetical protein EYM31_08040, partial [Acidobacteria bacterium]|nr:hypothetical protein [Acidobacteriota bacterium]
MTIGYVRVFVTLVVAGTLACGGAPPSVDSNDEGALSDPSVPSNREQFVGAWSLTTIERRNAEGDLLSAP